jgi:hypothetical protein
VTARPYRLRWFGPCGQTEGTGRWPSAAAALAGVAAVAPEGESLVVAVDDRAGVAAAQRIRVTRGPRRFPQSPTRDVEVTSASSAAEARAWMAAAEELR